MGVCGRCSASLCVVPGRCFGWSRRVSAGGGLGAGFMACKRPGVRIPIASPVHAHISNSEPVTGPAPEGHLRGSSAASVIVVGLLTCGGAEDGPALSAVLGIADVQEA